MCIIEKNFYVHGELKIVSEISSATQSYKKISSKRNCVTVIFFYIAFEKLYILWYVQLRPFIKILI